MVAMQTLHTQEHLVSPVISTQTLQNSKINNISDVIGTALRVIPKDDPYRVRDVSRCLRCAVVGNSGNLRNSNYGRQIDAHDFVFRWAELESVYHIFCSVVKI